MLPIQKALRANRNPEKAKILARFFKTGKGEYAEGDMFLGLTVPEIRMIVKHLASGLSLRDIAVLLASEYHEERFAGVITLVIFADIEKYPISEIAEFYMDHRDRINNWDLVDVSAEYIIGPYLSILDEEKRKRYVDECVESDHLWTQRIIILASFYHIKRGGDASLTLSLVPRFLHHPHDLIHKACGWMLREVGKRVSETTLCEFLDRYHDEMPRTMLRYAIERLDPEKKDFFMGKRGKRIVPLS